MSSVPTSNQDRDLLVVPSTLKDQLSAFRSRVWSSKMLEAFAFGVAAVLLAFLTVYLIDRFVDTPRSARMLFFFGALAAWIAIPCSLHRWVWKNRTFHQLARLLRVREPDVGDQLLSVLELAESETEQARSRKLCAAAIVQVAESAEGRDLREAAPPTKLRVLSMTLGVAFAAAIAIGLMFPAAASNAWARFSAPWKNTPRYTFTAIEPLKQNIIVPHGETTQLSIALTEDSKWQPTTASIQFEGLPPLTAKLTSGSYDFEIPAQVADAPSKLVVGDFYQSVTFQPKTRPELIGATASVQLPEYLERPDRVEMDVRSGTLAVVQGSRATLSATASRDLEEAAINDSPVPVKAASFGSEELLLAEAQQSLEMSWKDHDGLAGREPFELSINPAVDEVPTVLSQDFPRQAVVLDTEQINFQALAADDFGIKRVGISWKGFADEELAEPAEGERLIAAGTPQSTSMQVPATFTASKFGIDPQPIEVRLWVEDYLPGRERVYSTPHVLYVLTAEQHAIWITDQLSKWHRASLDVRDAEMQLYEKNKQLHSTPSDQLATEEMRGQIRRQAALENANGRRLSSLAKKGEGLLRQAARNPEIGVGHLDRWAEMLQILNDIGNERMPSVADLLTKASQQGQPGSGGKTGGKMGRPSEGQMAKSGQPGGENDSEKETMPKAGQNRDMRGGPGKPQPKADDFVNAKQVPKITDMESSMHPNEAKPEEDDSDPVEKKGNGSRLSLPNTTITGPGKKKEPGEKQEQQEKGEEEPLDEALFEQEELLAEFEKISDELNTVLANLEGSTLVKRLKAASREQDQVAQKIGARIPSVFGFKKSGVTEEDREALGGLSKVEEESSQKVSYIMDDMQAYFERRRMNQFKLVLEEMKDSEVLVALRDLGDEIPKQQGMSIAQAEFWSDTMDRWADDLVDPACSGQCPGCKTSDALPPSLILEVLKVLESEVNLREETRVAEQSRPGLKEEEHGVEANRLSGSQFDIRERVDAVVTAIEELPKGASRFGKEIKLLSSVSRVMVDATQILGSSDTGSAAIAAETEAIELLLQCKRINPKGGGGGGSSPGGGGKGETQDSALALLGTGLNQNEKREARDVSQATGETGRVLPEEFRAGLDKYFEQIEQAF